jgi:hypothetical protein
MLRTIAVSCKEKAKRLCYLYVVFTDMMFISVLRSRYEYGVQFIIGMRLIPIWMPVVKGMSVWAEINCARENRNFETSTAEPWRSSSYSSKTEEMLVVCATLPVSCFGLARVDRICVLIIL